MSDEQPNNPLLAVDGLLCHNDQIVLVRRSNPPTGWALPGGFVESGETVEQAVRREVEEETGLDIDQLRQWRVFSDPDRDPRQHVVSLCFTGRARGTPRAGTDAGEVGLFEPEPPWPELAFDHAKILEEAYRDGPLTSCSKNGTTHS